jgi:hypothetical protein
VVVRLADEPLCSDGLANAPSKARRDEEMQALKRLDNQARRLEAKAEGPSLESFIAVERAASLALDGRSVFGWEKNLDWKTTAGD